MSEQGVATTDRSDGVRTEPEATSGAADGRDFDVFLSHNSRDKPAVERLAERLKRDGLEPWLDKWCLTPGGTWQDELDAGIQASSACAVFVGPNGLGDWSREELYVARDRAVKERGGFRLFLVLLPGYPELFDASALPPFLANRTWVDLRGGVDDPRGFRAFVHAIRGIPLGPAVAIERRDDVCPYQGLQTFGEGDAEFFFGRDGDTQRLLEKLKAARSLAVLGPSGSGKSSLVRAGLVPALRKGGLPGSERWEICTVTPGSRPVERLALELARVIGGDDPLGAARTVEGHLRDDEGALDRAARLALSARPAPPGREQGRQLLLVIDQFEEVFTLCRDEPERTQFLANLLHATAIPDGSTTVVLTMRADFYHRCAPYPELAARVAAQQFLVSPMSQDGLRQAIEEPARRVGLELEAGLVEAILGDVADQPGSLPLLEHALLELWERRWGTMLTQAAYRESGGVRGAIAKRADTIYGAFSPEEQAIAERAFLRLTQLGEGTQDTRRRASLSELATVADEPGLIEGVVRRLADADARLLTTSHDPETGEDWVDISHEALIRSWPQLREWIDRGRADLQIHRRLTEAAQDWERLGGDDGLLYRGARLAEAVEWRERDERALNRLEREFLDASVALVERGQRAEEERRRRELEDAQRLAETESRRAQAAEALARTEKKARGRLRTFVAGVTALLVLALLTAGVAVQQRAEADTQRAEAESQRAQAESQQREAETQRTEAETQRAEAESQRAAAEAQQRVASSRELAATSASLLATDPELSLLLAAEAGRIAPTDQAADALRDSLRRSHARARLAHADWVQSAQFSPNGVRVVTGSRDGTARVWEAATGRAIAELRHGSSVASAQFSPDGARVATAGEDGTVRVWETATGAPLAELRGHAGPVLRAQFNPNGGALVTASRDGTARVWEPATGRIVVLGGHEGPLWRAQFSPDGGRIVTASEDGTARIWEAVTGAPLAELRGHAGPVLRAQFSPDGGAVLTASVDRTARLWEAATGRATAELRHADAVLSAQFSPDGARIATGSLDRTARVWEAATGRIVAEVRHAGPVASAFFDRDGRWLLTTGEDGVAAVWEAGTGAIVAQLRGHRGRVFGALFSPVDGRVVTAGADGTARVWEAVAGAALLELRHAGDVVGVEFSSDGGRLATASEDGTARVWEVTGRPVAELRHANDVASARFSPDGARVVTASEDGTARVWQAATGAALIELRGHDGAVYSARFSPDGATVVTAGADGTARVWEGSTGRLLGDLRGHDGAVLGAQLSPDGARVVTAGADGTARIWEAATGAALLELRGHRGRVLSAQFSPNGRQVVTAGEDGTARVWEGATGAILAEVRHANIVWDAQFSPDGERVVTASADGTARVWEAATGRVVDELRHTGPVLGAQFSPDGARVATAGADGAARIFNCDACGSLEELLALARERTTRELTPEERERYLHEPRRG